MAARSTITFKPGETPARGSIYISVAWPSVIRSFTRAN